MELLLLYLKVKMIKMAQKEYYTQEISQVLSSLNTSLGGLSSSEAQKRLDENGPNRLKEEKRHTVLEIFF